MKILQNEPIWKIILVLLLGTPEQTIVQTGRKSRRTVDGWVWKGVFYAE